MLGEDPGDLPLSNPHVDGVTVGHPAVETSLFSP